MRPLQKLLIAQAMIDGVLPLSDIEDIDDYDEFMKQFQEGSDHERD